MGTSWVAVSIHNITTQASREMTSRKNINIFDFNGGERCQALACGGARYLPSLIALFILFCTFTNPIRFQKIKH